MRKHRKLRRGGKSKSKKCANLIILHSNIRGLKSKRESLKNVLDLVNADMVLLNEHGVTGRNKHKCVQKVAKEDIFRYVLC